MNPCLASARRVLNHLARAPMNKLLVPATLLVLASCTELGPKGPVSEGTAGAPVVIAIMPYNGSVSSSAHSYYQYVTTVSLGTITMSNLTADVDLVIYTSASFTTTDGNWSCSVNSGTANDTCTASNPVPAGTTLYIKAERFLSEGSTFTLSVEAAPVAQGSVGAPLAITSVPFNGFVTTTAHSYYSFVTTGTAQTVMMSNLTADVDPEIYTTSNFTTIDGNWSCSSHSGTSGDNCTTSSPVASGTTLYIKAYRFSLSGASFTLNVLGQPAAQGTAGSPVAISSVPYTGSVGASTSSFYSFVAPAGSRVITLANMATDADPDVYTSSAFTTINSTWTCTGNGGSTDDTCTASSALSVATTIYIKVVPFFGGATWFTLNVTP